MIINHNLPGANAISKMNSNSATASKSMQKLSSGLRINGAADDAAGLAISEKMRGQIRGLDQASANSQDGISMIQTAEGALSETHSILQRMRELAVQSSNDTNVAVDRSEIQKEMDQLTKEVSRISNNTEFNTQKLINGGISETGTGSATFHVGANSGQNISLSINAMDAKSLGLTRDVSTSSIDTDNNDGKIATVSSDSVDVSKTLTDGKYKVELTTQAAGAISATDATGNPAVTGLVTGTATKDTNITLTYTDHGTAASNDAATALGSSVAINTASSLKINGTTVTLDAVKNLGTTAYDAATNENDVVSALQTDINKALGSDKYKVSVDSATHKLSIDSVATGAATKVDLTGSASASILGFTGTISGTDGSATSTNNKDWVATGSLGGVISGNNNTVNGITIDQSKLSSTAIVGEKITIKGFADATLSAQLQSVGTGVATTTQSTGAAATVATGAVTGTASDDTDVTLTYSTGAGIATKGTGNTVTIASDAVAGTATAATTITLTRTANAPAAAAVQTADADLAASIGFNTATKITIGGTDVTLTNVAALGAAYDGATNIDTVVTKLQQDIDATALSGDYTVGKSGSKLTLTSTATGLAAEIDLTGSDVGTGATLLGFTTLTAVNGTDATSKWVATGSLTGDQTEGATTSATNGLTVDLSKLTGAVNGDVVTVTGAPTGWSASGADAVAAGIDGVITGSSNPVNGLNIDMSKITGASVNGETVKISAKVGSDIGEKVTIDQKNGGSYVIGDADGAGQMKVGFTAGTAVGDQTSTVNITTDAAKASTKQADGTMSDATVAGGVDVSTQSKASAAITTIQRAIETVSSERSKLGAYSNRLEHTIANLGTSSENLTSAESRIRDVDMAKEMSTFSKNNILSQAAQAMLAQANQQPQQVLQLLR